MVCSRYARHYIHYDTALKRKCFLKFRNNVWERKIKWKLINKAESHYRHKLLLKYFRLWVIFLNKSLRKKLNVKFADSLFEEKLKVKGILAFKLNADYKWILISLYRAKIEWNLKVRTWHRWKHYTLKRLKIREIKLLSDKVREDKLVIKFFYIWSLRFKEKISLKGIEVKAVKEYETKLKRKCLNRWKIFKDKNLCKKGIYSVSNECYRHKLKRNFFNFWKNYIHQKKLYKNHVKIINNFYQNYVLTIYLNHWLTTYERFANEREAKNYSKASDFSDRTLLGRIFTKWRSFSEREKLRKEKFYAFHESYTNICLNHYIQTWKTKWEEKVKWNYLEEQSRDYRQNSLIELLLAKLLTKYKETIEERQQFSSALNYYNAIIVHRAFKGWQSVVLRKVDKRLKEESALEYHNDRIKKKIFDRWKEFVVIKRKKKLAIAYYKHLQLYRVMDKWKVYLEVRKTLMNKAINLERKWKEKLLTKAFRVWRSHTASLQTKMNVAIHFHKNSKMSKVFHHWKAYSQTKSVRKSFYNRNRNTLNNTTIKSVLFQWYDMLAHKRNLKRKIELINRKKNERLIRLYFTKWHQFHLKMKNLRLRIDFFPQLYTTITLDQYMAVLSKLLTTRKFLKRQEEIAVKGEEKILKRKFFNKWISFINWKRKKLAEYEVKYKNYQNSTDNFSHPVTGGKTSRRKPIIPDYLISEFSFEQSEDSERSFSHESTFEVVRPVNKRLPIADQEGMFISFEL